jgi:peroxisomal enoyl-CoA hydratase 2
LLWSLITETSLPEPSIGKRVGFGGPILHGLGTFGFAARAVLQVVPGELRYFSVRFTSPVSPGDALRTRIWIVSKQPRNDGASELSFETVDERTGKTVLGGGVAWIVRGEKSKL